jgi:glutathione S-transferase
MSAPDIEISAFAWVPDFAQGHVKDLRPRWALEEAGLPYRTRLLKAGEPDTAEYRAWQPFGQVPAYRDGEVALFESGAILLRISALSDALGPRDKAEEARITAWSFAALNSVEPVVVNVILPSTFHAGEEWVEGWRPHAERLLGLRLRSLARALDGRDWLAERFSVADILMATVLRGLEGSPLLAAEPVLEAYLARCLSRPAFERALAAQIADFSQQAA